MSKQQEHLIRLIKKWKWNGSFLAEKLSISKTTFSNKIVPSREKDNFTKNQLEEVSKILSEMKLDIEEYLKHYSSQT